jgi:hypothetical protein
MAVEVEVKFVPVSVNVVPGLCAAIWVGLMFVSVGTGF